MDSLAHVAMQTTAWLRSHLSTLGNETLHQAMAYSALAGGKRIRAFLVVESSQICGLSVEAALPAAAAVECLHAFSLIHDDLPAMDDSPLRRGVPSCHLAFDEATAILAGDALQAEAFTILSDPICHPDAGVRCALIHGLAVASGSKGMILGQMQDMAGEKTPLSLESLTQMQRHKTGALIRFSAEAGAILAGAPLSIREALRTYGDALGLLFQITDDILDEMGESTGKPQGIDAARGKSTFVSLLGLKEAHKQADFYLQNALESLVTIPHDTSGLKEFAAMVRDRKS